LALPPFPTRRSSDLHVSNGPRGRAHVKRRRRMDASFWILLALVGAAVIVAFARDTALPLRGLAASARLVRSVWIELALGFVLAGDRKSTRLNSSHVK